MITIDQALLWLEGRSLKMSSRDKQMISFIVEQLQTLREIYPLPINSIVYLLTPTGIEAASVTEYTYDGFELVFKLATVNSGPERYYPASLRGKVIFDSRTAAEDYLLEQKQHRLAVLRGRGWVN